MRVLLVEDDRELQELYRLALEQAGIKVSCAGNAQSALDILEEGAFNLLVIDLMLPEVNGLNILHELRTYDDWRDLPVYILSNFSAVEVGLTPRHIKELGVTKYLLKSQTKPGQLVSEVKALAGARTDANL